MTEYVIPDNYLDEARVLQGRVVRRCLIEACIMTAVVGLPALFLPISDFRAKVTAVVAICSPFFLLGITGFNGDSIFQTVRYMLSWLCLQPVVIYDGTPHALTESPVAVLLERETPKDRVLEYIDQIQAARMEQKGQELVEGEDFRFADDPHLAGLYAERKEEPELGMDDE